ncbi:MAG: hypothetical protein ABMA00_14660, partial [Gemmatimonas sp.]
RWVWDQLRVVVADAARRVPWWDSRLRSAGLTNFETFGPDEWRRVPVLEREELIEAGDQLAVPGFDSRLVRPMRTGGSTGIPATVLTGPIERGWGESASTFFREQAGLPRGARTAFLWGHHLDPIARDGWRERLEDVLWNNRWFDCFRLGPEILTRYHAALSAYQPALLLSYASAVGVLAEWAAANGLTTLGYPSTAIITGGEKLQKEHRRVAESVFSVPIHEQYGGRDVGMLAFQTRPRLSTDFVVDWGASMLEPETEETQSSILVTKLRADAMPMLRYRIGDIASFPPGSSPGSPAFTLEEIVGRELDAIWTHKGDRVHGIAFPHLFKDFPIHEFQVRQREDLSVDVFVVPRENFDEASGREIAGVISSNIGGADVRVTAVPAIERTTSGKLRPVIGLPRFPGKPSS